MLIHLHNQPNHTSETIQKKIETQEKEIAGLTYILIHLQNNLITLQKPFKNKK